MDAVGLVAILLLLVVLRLSWDDKRRLLVLLICGYLCGIGEIGEEEEWKLSKYAVVVVAPLWWWLVVRTLLLLAVAEALLLPPDDMSSTTCDDCGLSLYLGMMIFATHLWNIGWLTGAVVQGRIYKSTRTRKQQPQQQKFLPDYQRNQANVLPWYTTGLFRLIIEKKIPNWIALEKTVSGINWITCTSSVSVFCVLVLLMVVSYHHHLDVPQSFFFFFWCSSKLM
jgi:hypothetical protein